MTRKVSKSRTADIGEIIDSIDAVGFEWAEIAAIRLQKAMLYGTLLREGCPQSDIDVAWPEVESSEEFKKSTKAAKDIIIGCFTTHILKKASEGSMDVDVVVVDKNREVN